MRTGAHICRVWNKSSTLYPANHCSQLFACGWTSRYCSSPDVCLLQLQASQIVVLINAASSASQTAHCWYSELAFNHRQNVLSGSIACSRLQRPAQLALLRARCTQTVQPMAGVPSYLVTFLDARSWYTKSKPQHALQHALFAYGNDNDTNSLLGLWQTQKAAALAGHEDRCAHLQSRKQIINPVSCQSLQSSVCVRLNIQI